jgi:hypothetical protein
MTSVLKFDPKPASEVIYQNGSLVVCRECGKPIYKLARSIFYGEPVGKSAWKYEPVTVADLVSLTVRADLEPGQRAAIRAMTPEDMRTHCERIPTLKAGDFMDCPACKKQFSFGSIPENHDGPSMFGDKGYVVTLAIIPPEGYARKVAH